MAARDLTELLLKPQPLIIGIGASAGGLEALQDFLANLPDSHNYAIVIVQHLDPDHDSLLSSLLAKRTNTPVHTAVEGSMVEPGNIYLIAPGDSLTVADGVLHTEDFAKPRGRRRPIDQFFESLADNSGSNAVAVVLSGTGSDGSNGIRAIKEQGGLVFVQDPEQAKYDGMPRSAIETGAHDLVLPVGEMVEVLNDYFNHLGGLQPDHLTDAQFIERAMKHVRYRTGHDFKNYKPATLLRRIAVRMSVLGITQPNDYLKRLIESPSEVNRLFRDILINVTSFFRDPATFELLAEKVIPEILQEDEPDREVRIWVPGCSTGQEAYTIAMLFADAIERLDLVRKVSIFGTDIDDDALRVARQGVYPNSAADEVPENLLHKYFNWRPDGYEVTSNLRDMVRFSNQSIIKDPPFSRLDLVTCRNVLIYFDNDLQDVSMRVFQYGLRERGYLLLGSSESPGLVDDFFDEISQKHRLYRRRPGQAARLDLHTSSRGGSSRASLEPKAPSQTLDPYAEHLLNDFAPPYVVLSHTGELLFASEGAAKYLQMKSGRPQLEIVKLMRPELSTAVRRLLNRKLGSNDTIAQDFQGELGSETVRIRLSRKMLPDEQQLLVFQDQLMPIPLDSTEAAIAIVSPPTEYIQELEVELDEARQTIRTTVEELETSNEELKSSNEEMMSMNEELRSANEELTTTNDELNNKIAEVREINGDLENLISSTQIATVFLDSDLNLRSFTPEAQKMFRFVSNDKGRRIDDIGTDLDIRQLMDDCCKVSEKGRPVETEYATLGSDRVYRARIVPYLEEDELTGGIVFTLVDITEIRGLAVEADRQTRLAQAHFAEIQELYDISPQAMALVSEDMTYTRANKQLATMNGLDVADIVGKQVTQVIPVMGAQIAPVIKTVLETGQKVESLRAIGHTLSDPADERVWEADFYPVLAGTDIKGVGVNVRDITEHARMSFELRRMMQELQHRVKNMLANVLALVSRASRDATEEKEVFVALSKRIQALAQTHKLLTQSNWSSAKLHELLVPELVDVYGDDRVKLKGPQIEVNARAALSLGMAIHELATNAAKYGCFSVPEGNVSLNWIRQDDGERNDFIFTWRETGGPAPKKTAKDGFGSQLIRSTIEGSLNGIVSFERKKTGLVCIMQIPANVLIEIPDDTIYDMLTP